MGFDGNMTSDVIYRRRRPLTHHTLYRNIYFSIISYLTAYIVKLYPKSEAPLIGICITTTHYGCQSWCLWVVEFLPNQCCIGNNSLCFNYRDQLHWQRSLWSGRQFRPQLVRVIPGLCLLLNFYLQSRFISIKLST